MKFRVRIDEFNEQVRTMLVEYVKGKTHTLVHHILPHGNPHFHLYIDMPLVNSPQAYRYQIKKLFQIEDKTMYSVKECDAERLDEYLQYLFNTKHGNRATLLSTTVDTGSHQANAHAISEDFEERKSKRAKRATITSWDIAEQLRERINNYDESNDHEWRVRIIEDAIEIHRQHRKTYCDFSLIRVIQTAMGGTKYATNLHNQIYSKLFSGL